MAKSLIPTSIGLRIDTELLISLIEQNRCIWDTSNEHYKNRDLKQQAFEEVASVAIPNYHDMTESQKEKAVNVVQKRWRTARDAYRRDRNKMKNIKSAQAAKRAKMYVFYENLKFLEQVMELNAAETSFSNDALDNEPTGDTIDFSDSENARLLIPEVHLEESSVISSTLKNSAKSSAKTKLKKEKDIEEKLIAFLQSTASSVEQADDRAFLESLLPMLKSFDEAKKLQFRAEVLRIMMEIKNIPTFRPVPQSRKLDCSSLEKNEKYEEDWESK